MKCAGCDRELEVGDRYILDSASGFLAAGGTEVTSEFDGLMAQILGGEDGKVAFCEDCTTEGGDYLFETFYGDEVSL